MPNDEETKLECLRLAVELGAQINIENPMSLAEKYFAWVTEKSADKRNAPRRKPVSKAE